MEETKKKSTKKNNVIGQVQIGSNRKIDGEKITNTEFQRREEMNVIGWRNAMECANDLWSSIHSSLLSGNLVFAYKETKSGSEFGQIVVVQNINFNHDFAIGMITSGYTMLLPHIPYEYLETVVLEDFKKYKINQQIVEIYKQIIEDYNPNIRTNGK